MLTGNELEGNIGEVGNYTVDVDLQGNVKISLEISKDFGHSKASTVNSVEVNIFDLAEAIAKKTETTLDDKAIAALKSLLGLDKPEVVEAVAALPDVQS